MADRDLGGTPGWRERLDTVAGRVDAGHGFGDAMSFVYALSDHSFDADLRAAASSQERGGGPSERPAFVQVVDAARNVLGPDNVGPLEDDAREVCYATAVDGSFVYITTVPPASPPPAGAQVDREAAAGDALTALRDARVLAACLREAFPGREFLWREGDTFGRLTPETLADLLANVVTDG